MLIWFVIVFRLIYSLSNSSCIIPTSLNFIVPLHQNFSSFIPYSHYVEVAITILALSSRGMSIPHGSVSSRTRIRVRLQTPVPARPTARSDAILLIAQIALFVWVREKRLDAIHCCCCLFVLFWSCLRIPRGRAEMSSLRIKSKLIMLKIYQKWFVLHELGILVDSCRSSSHKDHMFVGICV